MPKKKKDEELPGYIKNKVSAEAVAAGAIATGAVATGAIATGAVATGAVATGAVATGAVAVGKKVPNFKAATTAKVPFELEDYRGKKIVLYFYPKDHTSGCTTEGLDFTRDIKKFKNANTEILGVSRESLDSHMKFIEKQNFKFNLLSDPDEVVCKLFDVIKQKSMYGKKYMGIERSTFLINEDSKLVHEWRKVKVPGHVDEVLEMVRSI